MLQGVDLLILEKNRKKTKQTIKTKPNPGLNSKKHAKKENPNQT